VAKQQVDHSKIPSSLIDWGSVFLRLSECVPNCNGSIPILASGQALLQATPPYEQILGGLLVRFFHEVVDGAMRVFARLKFDGPFTTFARNGKSEQSEQLSKQRRRVLEPWHRLCTQDRPPKAPVDINSSIDANKTNGRSVGLLLLKRWKVRSRS
jgi:hypothetical protein